MWVCPECGAKETIELMDTEKIVQSNKVDYTRRTPARMKEIKVTDQFQCQLCNHTWTRSFIQRERVRVDHKKI